MADLTGQQQTLGCLSLMCQRAPLDGGLCVKHLLEMIRFLRLGD